MSLILAAAGATNEMLSMECKVSAPSTYNVFGYCIICIFGGLALKREEKLNKRRADIDTTEEQERFQTSNDHEDDEDELTMDGSETRPSRFSFRRSQRSHQSNRLHDSNNRSSDSKNKIRTYPFLFGLFTIHAKWYYYAFVAFIEAQAYYLIFLAFRYTSFTFVYVSDALAIPSAMIFTKLLMKRSYLWLHLLGGAVCMAGIVVNTASDMTVENGLSHATSAEHIRGDLYAIVGAILLGLDDVLSEILVTDYGSVTEMLFMKGFFGTLISIAQLALFELDNVMLLFGENLGAPCDINRRMTLFFVHVVFRAMDVWGEMQFLLVSEAALLNLMLLTSDLYAAVFDVIRIGLHLTGYFYAAFAMICFGIVLYEAGPSPTESSSNVTPKDIEFRSREGEAGFADSFAASTEHAGNLTNRLEGTLA